MTGIMPKIKRGYVGKIKKLDLITHLGFSWAGKWSQPGILNEYVTYDNKTLKPNRSTSVGSSNRTSFSLLERKRRKGKECMWVRGKSV